MKMQAIEYLQFLYRMHRDATTERDKHDIMREITALELRIAEEKLSECED